MLPRHQDCGSEVHPEQGDLDGTEAPRGRSLIHRELKPQRSARAAVCGVLARRGSFNSGKGIEVAADLIAEGLGCLLPDVVQARACRECSSYCAAPDACEAKCFCHVLE